LTEYRDGVSYTVKDGSASWYRSTPDSQPVFRSESTDGKFKINIYSTEIFIEHQFTNQNGGTTQYSLTIRRSTGRFTESYSSEGIQNVTHSGTCAIYR
jgi:hypothetical protein